MLEKIKLLFKSKSNSVLLKQKLEELRTLRNKTDTLVIYGTPTQGNWLGIANATIGLFPNNAIAIPQWFSNSVFNKKEINAVCRCITDLKFEHILISGFAPFFFDYIDILHKTTNIDTLFHGTISEFHEKEKQRFIGKLIEYGKNKKIKRFGFVKAGLAEVFEKLYGFSAYHQPLNPPSIPDEIKKLKLDKNKIHIGVFGADTFNKNLHNQVIHALQIDKTVVHVLEKNIFSYLGMEDRIEEHGKNLSREVFLGVLGSMDVNLYMSYSESWGLVAFESEAMGVPCIKTDDINYMQKIKSFVGKKR